jgi:hypothetical protein
VLRADLIGIWNMAREARGNPRDAATLALVVIGVPLFFFALWIDVRVNAASIVQHWQDIKFAGVGAVAFFGLMRGFRVLPLALDKAFGGWLAVLPISLGERMAAAIVAATGQIAFWAAPFALTGFVIGYETGVWPAGAVALAATLSYASGITLGYVIALTVATRPWVKDGDERPSGIALAARMRFRARRRARGAGGASLGGWLGRTFDRLDAERPRWIAHWAWGDDRLRNGLFALAFGMIISQGWAIAAMVGQGHTGALPVVAAGAAHMAFIVACLAKPAGIAALRVSSLGFGRAAWGVARLGILLSLAAYMPLALLAVAIEPKEAGSTAVANAGGLIVLNTLYLFSALRRPASAIAGIIGYFGGLTLTGIGLAAFGSWGLGALPLYILGQAHIARRRFRGHAL